MLFFPLEVYHHSSVWLKAMKFCGSLWNWTNFTSGTYCRMFRGKVKMEKEPGSCMGLNDSAQVPNPSKSYWCLFFTFSSWRSYASYNHRNYHYAITCWVSLVMNKTKIRVFHCPCCKVCITLHWNVCWSAAHRYICLIILQSQTLCLCCKVLQYQKQLPSCFRQQNYHWPIKL